MSPAHEQLFSLLCVLEGLASHARRKNADDVECLLRRVHRKIESVLSLLYPPLKEARVSLKVRTAVEQIFRITENLHMTQRPYGVLEEVSAIAVWGTEKSRLLTAVSARTWQEQRAGRAALARRRDYPEFEDGWLTYC